MQLEFKNLIVGDTRSGKALYEYLAIRAKRRSESEDVYAAHSSATFHKLTNPGYEEAAVRASIKNVFDLRVLGSSRARPEFLSA